MSKSIEFRDAVIAAVDDFTVVASLAAVELRRADMTIEVALAPHEPLDLPQGKAGVYVFAWNGTVLKVGKTTRRERSKYHHYGFMRSKSSLAESLKMHGQYLGLVVDDLLNITSWICSNVDRIDVRVDASLGQDALNLLEAFMIARLKPIFEGRRVPTSRINPAH